MTHQPPRASLIEAATQAAIGQPLGFAVVFIVSLLGLSALATACLSAGAMFFVSTARGYWIRRCFELDKEAKDEMMNRPVNLSFRLPPDLF